MASNQTVPLQVYVNELLQVIEDMRDKRELLKQQIYEEEEEKNYIENELNIKSERLNRINDFLVKTHNEKRDLEKTITETENTKYKIVESFKTLLSVLQKESFYHIKQQEQ